jgi:hypothetical protein
VVSEPFTVALDGFVMRLRPSEVEAVAAGLAAKDASAAAGPGAGLLTEQGALAAVGAGVFAEAAAEARLSSVVEAVRRLDPGDRAPLWELAVRHYARRKPLEQAAGEIGMDGMRARALLALFLEALRGTLSARN